MKKLSVLIALVLLLMVAAPVQASPNQVESTTVVAVNKNDSVTVRLESFPANETYYVLMNVNGTLGINGYLSSKITTNKGGTFIAEFPIPEELSNESIINIRFENSSGSTNPPYNWFYNENAAYNPIQSSSGSTTGNYNVREAYTPWFTTTQVVRNDSIIGVTSNFPEGVRVVVYVKDGGLANNNWIEVSGFNTDAGGIQTVTIAIPSALINHDILAIKFFNLNTNKTIFVNLIDNLDYP